MSAAAARPRVVVIGAGPAGLMAAERLSGLQMDIDVYDAMPSVGRKFLLAGIGGLNLTHSEGLVPFARRYGSAEPHLVPLLRDFGPDQICAWAAGLGIKTFVGTSGRIFPEQMKAAPLLRAWLLRLKSAGVRFHMRHRWRGWTDQGQLAFAHLEKLVQVKRPDALVLALGGASWPRLGSDAAWIDWVAAHGVRIAPFLPANCGFDVGWTDRFATQFAGAPLKPVVLSVGTDSSAWSRQGELVVTQTGVEGSLVYAASALLRGQILESGAASVTLDLMPGRSAADLLGRLQGGRGGRSLAERWRVRIGLTGVKANLVREVAIQLGHPPRWLEDNDRLVALLKRLPLTLTATRPIAEAISSAGGVCWSELDDGLMLRALPGVFCAGEMIDWEAPTGGYLLTGCLTTGVRAAQGVAGWLSRSRHDHQ